jgi:hypothetical protein
MALASRTARISAISNDALAREPAAAAFVTSARVASAERNAKPPSGSRQTSGSTRVQATSASSARQYRTQRSPSGWFTLQVLTDGNLDRSRTIEGCSTRRAEPSSSGLSQGESAIAPVPEACRAAMRAASIAAMSAT